MTWKTSLKRYGDHQELANLSAYLLSDYSDYINGEIITIDGAEWIHNAGQFNKLDKVPKNYGPLLNNKKIENDTGWIYWVIFIFYVL